MSDDKPKEGSDGPDSSGRSASEDGFNEIMNTLSQDDPNPKQSTITSFFQPVPKNNNDARRESERTSDDTLEISFLEGIKVPPKVKDANGNGYTKAISFAIDEPSALTFASDLPPQGSRLSIGGSSTQGTTPTPQSITLGVPATNSKAKRRATRRSSADVSVGSRGSSSTRDTLKTPNTYGTKTSRVSRRSPLVGMDQLWGKLGRKSDVWEEVSDLGDDGVEEGFGKQSRWQSTAGCIIDGVQGQWRWLRSTLKTAIFTPSVLIPCLVLFVVMVVCGLLVVHGFETAETNSRKQTATAVAEQTDLFFVRVLENAFVPLFTIAQFIKELPEFHLLDNKIGERCDPQIDVYNCAQSTSIPVKPGKEITHRDMTTLMSTEYGQMIFNKFDDIAAGIKANSGLDRSIANMQIAPKGVVAAIHPMVNCDDYEGDYCMNSTGAWGHDLLNDPDRKGIAIATVPADGVVTAGPLKIIQGDDTFIARLAINFPPDEGVTPEDWEHQMVVDGVRYPCWGFAVVILDWKRLKADSGIYEDFEAEGMQFKLTRTDIRDGKAKVVTIAESANPELIEADNITLALNTGDNGWVIAAGYDDGFSPGYKKWAYPLVFCISFVLAFMMMLVLVSKKQHQEILENLMPKKAIKKLAKGETVIERYKRVTIFFSDIVGYTKMSSEMTPLEVMNMLNGLYSQFDILAKKHDIYKVETIGDAYIAIAGAPGRCSGPRAAEKLTLFSLDALNCVKAFETADGSKIAIRIGLASGPVVAGVVGMSLPKYCLFGDTVNFAARMEQTGINMKLQICPVTHRMLIDAPNYNFHREERVDENGELGVECKGKGRQYTYWVNSATKLDKEKSTRVLSGSSSSGLRDDVLGKDDEEKGIRLEEGPSL